MKDFGDCVVSRSQTAILFRSRNKMAVWVRETRDCEAVAEEQQRILCLEQP